MNMRKTGHHEPKFGRRKGTRATSSDAAKSKASTLGKARGKRAVKKAALAKAEADVESDIELDPEDTTFYEQNASYASFLSSMDTSALEHNEFLEARKNAKSAEDAFEKVRKNRRLERAKEQSRQSDSAALDAEHAPRTSRSLAWAQSMASRDKVAPLPIKTDGQVQMPADAETHMSAAAAAAAARRARLNARADNVTSDDSGPDAEAWPEIIDDKLGDADGAVNRADEDSDVEDSEDEDEDDVEDDDDEGQDGRQDQLGTDDDSEAEIKDSERDSDQVDDKDEDHGGEHEWDGEEECARDAGHVKQAVTVAAAAPVPKNAANHKKKQARKRGVPMSLAEQEQYYRECKVRIAGLAEGVLADPAACVRRKRGGGGTGGTENELHALLDFCDDTHFGVQKLAVVSLMAVYSDVLPGYRVRMRTELEKTQRMKKEHKDAQESDELLLSSYQRYLQILDRLASGTSTDRHAVSKVAGANAEPHDQVRCIAVHCMCELLRTRPWFNFRTNLIRSIVPRADSVKGSVVDDRCAELCCSAIVQLFESDKSGEASVECVRLISKLVKRKGLGTSPRLLRTLFSLDMAPPTDGSKNSKRKRKRDSDDVDKAVYAGLRDAEATTSARELRKVKAELLQVVMIIFFRILKQGQASKLLPVALDGIERNMHLVNFEIVADVVSTLKTLLQSDTPITCTAALHCISTALCAAQHAVGVIEINPDAFVKHLYKLLPSFAQQQSAGVGAGNSNDDVMLLLRCLRQALLRRKELMEERVAAFVKRLAAIVPHLTAHQALAVTTFTRALLERYPRLRLLLGSESDRAVTGTYLAESNEADYCNALASSLWEFSWLRRHVHPAVKEHAAALVRGGTIVMSQCEAPAPLMKKHDMMSTGELDPPMQLPKKKQKSQAVFVHQPANISTFLSGMLSKIEYVDMFDTNTIANRCRYEE